VGGGVEGLVMGAGLNRLGQVRRSLLHIFCFAFFAIGGMVVSCLGLALLAVLPWEPARKQALARRAIGFFFRMLVRFLTATGCMRLQISGREHLDASRGALVLANHPTYIDVVILLSLLPNANCVVKGALWRNPFYWGIVRAAGYIQNDSTDDALQQCRRALQAGEPLLLFPEGTRTVPGCSPRFQRGAAQIALRSQARMIPVLLSCDPATLTKDSPWWKAPERPFTYRIVAQAALPCDRFVSGDDHPAKGARLLTVALQQYFFEELQNHGPAGA
jgi:1-acyl-sn-glycerol-3-phosphate acyltransferase